MPDEADLDMNDKKENASSLQPVRGRFEKLKNALVVLFASKTAVVGLFLVLFWVATALFAPYITGYGPNDQDWKAPNQGPSWSHPLGTDELGRDLWSRLAYGARIIYLICG